MVDRRACIDWTASPKLTISGGLRFEHYPLMPRVGRGLEILDYKTYTPRPLRIQLGFRFAFQADVAIQPRWIDSTEGAGSDEGPAPFSFAARTARS